MSGELFIEDDEKIYFGRTLDTSTYIERKSDNLEIAADILDKAISSSNDVSGAVFLPEKPEISSCVMNIEKTFKLNDLKHKGSFTSIRVEGSQKSVDRRIENLIKE